MKYIINWVLSYIGNNIVLYGHHSEREVNSNLSKNGG